MLRSVLSPEECAECRFCCSFRRQSLWETPVFDASSAGALKKKYPFAVFRQTEDDSYTVELRDKYTTDDPEEEVPCPFNRSGCILGKDEKPFDCSIWPLRVMLVDGRPAICLTPTCPVISSKPLSIMQELAMSSVGDTIARYAEENPRIIKEYREGFPVLRKL